MPITDKDRIKELEESLRRANEQIQRANVYGNAEAVAAKLGAADKELKAIQAKLAEAQSKIRYLETHRAQGQAPAPDTAKLAALERDNKSLQQRLDTVGKTNVDLRASLTRRDQQIAEMQQRLDQIAPTGAPAASTDDEVQQLRTELEKLRAELGNTRERAAALDRAQRSATEYQRELEGQKKSLESVVADLRTELQTARVKVKMLEKDVSELLEAPAQPTEGTATTATDHTECDERISKLQKEVQSWEVLQKVNRGRIDELMEQKSKLNSELAQAIADKDKVEQEHSKQLAEASSENRKLQHQIDQLKAKLDELETRTEPPPAAKELTMESKKPASAPNTNVQDALKTFTNSLLDGAQKLVESITAHTKPPLVYCRLCDGARQCEAVYDNLCIVHQFMLITGYNEPSLVIQIMKLKQIQVPLAWVPSGPTLVVDINKVRPNSATEEPAKRGRRIPLDEVIEKYKSQAKPAKDRPGKKQKRISLDRVIAAAAPRQPPQRLKGMFLEHGFQLFKQDAMKNFKKFGYPSPAALTQELSVERRREDCIIKANPMDGRQQFIVGRVPSDWVDEYETKHGKKPSAKQARK